MNRIACLVITSLLLFVSQSFAQDRSLEKVVRETYRKLENYNAAAQAAQSITVVKQAQGILKTRGFYAGAETGKLDPDTRAGLKKFQEAESLNVTGTLNKVTLVKMGIVLTEKQKTM